MGTVWGFFGLFFSFSLASSPDPAHLSCLFLASSTSKAASSSDSTRDETGLGQNMGTLILGKRGIHEDYDNFAKGGYLT